MASQTTYVAFKTWLQSVWSATTIYYENDAEPLPADLSPFLYLELRGGLFEQMSIGSPENLWRENGTAHFHVAVASGTGIELLRGYCSVLVELLMGRVLSPGITCREVTVGLPGPFRDNGNYYALPVIARWQRDE